MKTKDETDYNVATDPAMSCGKCTSFVAPASCSIVQGTISDQGTCKAFTPGANAPVEGEGPAEPPMDAAALMNAPGQDMASKMGF